MPIDSRYTTNLRRTPGKKAVLKSNKTNRKRALTSLAAEPKMLQAYTVARTPSSATRSYLSHQETETSVPVKKARTTERLEISARNLRAGKRLEESHQYVEAHGRGHRQVKRAANCKLLLRAGGK